VGPSIVKWEDPMRASVISVYVYYGDDEKSCRPDDVRTLSENELQILERWITLGASDTVKLVIWITIETSGGC